MDVSIGRSREAHDLEDPRLVLSLDTKHMIGALRGLADKVICRELLVLIYVSISLIIEPKSDQKLSHTDAVILSKGSELNGVYAIKTGV